MNRELWMLPRPDGVKVIEHAEILRRARRDLEQELAELLLWCREARLPESCVAEDRKALLAKISAVRIMLAFECGEYD